MYNIESLRVEKYVEPCVQIIRKKKFRNDLAMFRAGVVGMVLANCMWRKEDIVYV